MRQDISSADASWTCPIRQNGVTTHVLHTQRQLRTGLAEASEQDFASNANGIFQTEFERSSIITFVN
jgi:hypothetical protein